MRIFSISSKLANGVRTVASVNATLTADDLLVIKTCLEKHKPFENSVMESCRSSIVESIIESEQ